MFRRPPSRPLSARRATRCRSSGQAERSVHPITDEEAGRTFLQELRDALPAELLAALPQMPVTLLFVVYNQAKAGVNTEMLMQTYRLTEHEIRVLDTHVRIDSGGS